MAVAAVRGDLTGYGLLAAVMHISEECWETDEEYLNELDRDPPAVAARLEALL